MTSTMPSPNQEHTAPRPPSAPSTAVRLDRRRYLRIVLFLVYLFVHVVWWDVVLRRFLPLGVAARSADRRWRSLAVRYRRLAVRLGGLQIKMGQFLSTRVDVLPSAVTQELSGLQDEVPPVPFDDIAAAVERAFDRPADDVFAWIDPVPVGAASLAQVHRARLPDGSAVVIKVQRPRIDVLVETDLAAFRLGTRMLKQIRWVRRRADLDQLFAEFARTSRGELDFLLEGRHAELFAESFAEDPRVKVPTVFWTHSTRTVLALEDVTALKISDVDALRAAGVDPADVAHVLIEVYLEQIFAHNFVHVDPHPGNLFVHPRDQAGAPDFAIAFVDFGMVAVVPERVRSLLRDYIVGLATRDAPRIVRAYHDAGVLLPGADLDRIEQATAAVLDRFYGVRMGDVQALAAREAGAMVSEFGDILREMPFQLPADMLFIGRAVGILSGLATQLDPDFNLWEEIAPFARRLAAGEGEPPRWTSRLGPIEEPVETLLLLAAALESPARSLVTLPGALERVLNDASTGQLTIRYELARDTRRDALRATSVLRGTTWAIVFAGLVVGGAVLRASEGPSVLSDAMLVGAAIALAAAVLRR